MFLDARDMSFWFHWDCVIYYADQLAVMRVTHRGPDSLYMLSIFYADDVSEYEPGLFWEARKKKLDLKIQSYT